MNTQQGRHFVCCAYLEGKGIFQCNEVDAVSYELEKGNKILYIGTVDTPFSLGAFISVHIIKKEIGK